MSAIPLILAQTDQVVALSGNEIGEISVVLEMTYNGHNRQPTNELFGFLRDVSGS